MKTFLSIVTCALLAMRRLRQSGANSQPRPARLTSESQQKRSEAAAAPSCRRRGRCHPAGDSSRGNPFQCSIRGARRYGNAQERVMHEPMIRGKAQGHRALPWKVARALSFSSVVF